MEPGWCVKLVLVTDKYSREVILKGKKIYLGLWFQKSQLMVSLSHCFVLEARQKLMVQDHIR